MLSLGLRTPRTRLATAILAVATIVSGCQDGGGPNIGPPASVSIQAGNNQTATAGTAVATAPSVIVRDADGDAVPGVSVTFAVASGGGSVSGATATTGANGVATVGGWTLGTAAGTNTLTATAAGVSQQATFTATGTADVPANVTAQSGTPAQAPVGSAVTTRPSVRVTDQYGNPVPNATVTFGVTSGGGTATQTTVTTGQDGIATVGSWTLGTTAGANTMTATVTGLTPVTFTVTGTPLGPAVITVADGNNQTALAGTAVPVAPSVVVRDQHNNPVPNVTVTFSPVAGGGTVTGATQTTNAAGVATVGSWTLGSPGPNVLRATVAGIAPVDITATAIDPCTVAMPLAVGSSANGTLTTSDCAVQIGNGVFYYDLYAVTANTSNMYVFDMSGSFDTFLELYSGDVREFFGWNNDSPGSTNSTLRVIAAQGSYILGATSNLSRATGSYTVAASTAPSADVTGCPAFGSTLDVLDNFVWITRGVSTTQQLQSTDCSVAAPGAPGGPPLAFADRIAITMHVGQTYTITMTASFNTYLHLRDPQGNLVAFNDDFGGTTNSQIVFMPQGPAGAVRFLVIEPSSFAPAITGPYTLMVQATAPPAAARASIGSKSRRP
jgi:hypothetical protein